MKAGETLLTTMTRRQSLVGAAMAIGGIAMGSTKAWAATDDGISHTAVAIHQEPVLTANPKRIYEALTDAKQFQKVQLMSGAMKAADLEAKPAEISLEVGGPITLFGGYITGRQIELVADRRIVQVWKTASWPEGVYSIVRFELVAQGTGTKLVFDHTGFPAGEAEHLASGWKAHYWEPLQKFLS
jgi:activator of HSP90 ATPase